MWVDMSRCILFLAHLVLLAAPLRATDGWPRSFTSNGTAYVVYQPQVTSWTQNILTARAAVSVQPQGAAQPAFGTVLLSATTEVDQPSQTVSLADLAVSQATFPTLPDQAASFGSAIVAQAAQWAQNLSLPALKANLAVSRAEGAGTKPVAVQNPVPRIFFSEKPSILVLVDGEPALRNVPNTQILRAINTQALLAMDPASGLYYLRVNGGWVQSQDLAGAWTASSQPPAGLAAVLESVAGSTSVELFNPPDASQPGPTPEVFVSTVPAELVTTNGPLQFEPVPSTQLLHVTNSSSSIFINVTSQLYYVVISGRWFASSDLAGPWQFVPANQLPADFAKIPETAPAGAVLPSVAGTAQASEAAISSSIPQTSAISKNTTTKVSFDGEPKFEPISGTPLSYAVNTPTPVIRVSENEFYAVDNAVWFMSSSPSGPWKIATKVPEVIYTIPPSSPVYYVTNVFVYNSTPDVVYVGYTPGYFGTVLSPDGVVVFGTGYAYPPYIGPTVWYGPPLTYGFGAGFACGLATGFAFGLAVDHGWGCSPWWGPWHGGWGDVNVNRTWNNVNVNTTNVYNRWGNNQVNNTNISKTVTNTNVNTTKNQFNAWKSGDHPNAQRVADNHPRVPDEGRKTNDLGGDDVFAGTDDHAYRSRADGGWQEHSESGWRDTDETRMEPRTRSDLETQRAARSAGAFRGGGFRR